MDSILIQLIQNKIVSAQVNIYKILKDWNVVIKGTAIYIKYISELRISILLINILRYIYFIILFVRFENRFK
jgi:hypothetical protein